MLPFGLLTHQRTAECSNSKISSFVTRSFRGLFIFSFNKTCYYTDHADGKYNLYDFCPVYLVSRSILAVV